MLVIWPEGRDGSATIDQDADIYRIRLQPGQTVTHELKRSRGARLQIAEGVLSFNGNTQAVAGRLSSDATMGGKKPAK